AAGNGRRRRRARHGEIHRRAGPEVVPRSSGRDPDRERARSAGRDRDLPLERPRRLVRRRLGTRHLLERSRGRGRVLFGLNRARQRVRAHRRARSSHGSPRARSAPVNPGIAKEPRTRILGGLIAPRTAARRPPRGVRTMMRTSLLFTASTLFASVTFAPVASAGDGVARVSVASDGSQATGSSGQYGAAISGNGRYVVFGSFANNFDPRDFNGNGENVYLHDRDPDGNGIFDEGNGTTTLVDVTLSGNAGYGGIVGEDITPDGRFVVFSGACPVFVE